jgi:hypothetical protein
MSFWQRARNAVIVQPQQERGILANEVNQVAKGDRNHVKTRSKPHNSSK